MPVINKTTGSFLHEEGEDHPATIVDIIDDEGPFGPQLKYILEVDGDGFDEDGNPKTTWAFSSQNYSVKSKLGLWTSQILGSMPEELDTDDLVGQRVLVTFEQYVKPDPKTGEPLKKEKVVNLQALA